MRSFLFVPADSERKLAKGPSSGPDGLILDQTVGPRWPPALPSATKCSTAPS